MIDLSNPRNPSTTMHRIWQILSNNILHDTRRTASFIAAICSNDKNDAITLHTPESGMRSMKFLHGKIRLKNVEIK